MQNTTQNKIIFILFSMLIFSLILSNMSSSAATASLMDPTPPPVEFVKNGIEPPLISPLLNNPTRELEQVHAQAALEAALTKFLGGWEGDYTAVLGDIQIDNDWAYGVAEWRSEARLVDAPIHILARRDSDGTWQALTPSNGGLYLQWLHDMPDELISSNQKENLHIQAGRFSEIIEIRTSQPNVTPISELQKIKFPPPPQSRQAVGIISNNPTLISDSLFLFSSSVLDFNIQSFLETQNSTLSDYQEYIDGEAWSAAEIIRYNAILFGINPQTIIVILEADNHLISTPNNQMSSNLTFDSSVSLEGSFYHHVNDIAQQLLAAFEVRKYNEAENRIVFNEGDSIIVDTDTNAGTYAVQTTLAQVLSAKEWGEWSLGNNPSFIQIFENWFSSPLINPDSSIQSVTALPSDYLLPFPVGETWYYTGGPHTYTSSGARPWSSIDLAQPEQVGCPGGDYLANRWIVAAKGGSVIESSQALVVIDHGDGWRTYYSHVATPDRRGVGGINQGDPVGHPSCEVEPGGDTTGIHLHFAIWQAGVGFVDISGSSLSDWFIQETTHYNGTMTRNGVVRTASVGRYNGINDILNSGGSTPPGEQVKLFDQINYQGSVVFSGGTGFSNDPNANSYSMEIPSGWSVKTWREDNRGGEERCWTGSVSNLQDHGWQNAIQSIEAFDYDACPPPGGDCSPGSNEVSLFVDGNYGGQCVTKGIGDYANPSAIGLPNDSISSIRVGSNAQAILCRDDNFSSTCETFTGDDSNLSDNAIGNDQVSSARVQSTGGGDCTPGSNEMALFVDANYSGQCVIKSLGNYRNPSAIGLPNDSISSIRLGSDTVAVLCANDNYAGTCEAFTGDDPNLSDNSVGNDNVSSAWADANASSFKVLLYEHPDFQGGGCGFQAAGASNVCSDFNDIASSVRIMPGWSARVWVDSDFNGSSRCLTASDSNLSDNTFENGGQMDNQISSFAAYNQSSCPPLPPSAPSNVVISGTTQNSITLSWQDNSSNEDGFNIYDWNGTSFVYLDSVGANIITFTDSGLSCGADYFYEVSAYNSNGESAHTSWVMGSTDACPSVGPLVYDGRLIDDDANGQSSGNGDGVINPGETIELYAYLVNQGVGTATGVNASLTTSDAYVTFLYNTNSGYPDIGGGGTAVNLDDWDFTVDASAPDGHIITFCLDPITAVEGGPWSSCFDVTVQAHDTAVLSATAVPNPLTIASGSSSPVTYSFTESGGTAVHITERTALFTLLDGVTALSDPIGPYGNDITIPGSGSSSWEDNIYLPPDVVNNAAGYGETAVLLRTTFSGLDEYNRPVSVDVDVQINIDICQDATEPNDTPAQALSIAYGQTQSGYICPSGDVDYYTFTGSAGDKIVIDVDAMSAGSPLDPYIFLLDSDGTTTLAENDDEIMGDLRDSILGYELPHDGTYYIKLRAWDHPSAGGPDHFYDIHLFTDSVTPSVQLTSHSDAAWLNPTSVTLTATASDNESGVKFVYFWWHSNDWDNTDWVSLGSDYDGRDGWQFTFDTSALPEQAGGALWVSAYDWTGNRANHSIWQIGIDRTAPNSAVQALPAQQPYTAFSVYWSGSDNVSGIAAYDVQYRDGADGTWTNWLVGTTVTTATFTGEAGHTYYFRARARDNANNQESYPSGDGDTVTTIDTDPGFAVYLPIVLK